MWFSAAVERFAGWMSNKTFYECFTVLYENKTFFHLMQYRYNKMSVQSLFKKEAAMALHLLKQDSQCNVGT